MKEYAVKKFFWSWLDTGIKVEAYVTDHSRDFASTLEKYKVVQFFPV